MRKGDTLIEVAIAIAVFSLVAIGVVSVVNGSTSSTQSALEVTVSREEIDAQAEALVVNYIAERIIFLHRRHLLLTRMRWEARLILLAAVCRRHRRIIM